MRKKTVIIFAVLLFTVAFFLRVYKLDYEGINPDEDTWHKRIDNFISAVREGNWFYTQQSLHPGVTFEWLTAGGRIAGGLAGQIPEGDFWSGFWQRHRAMVMPIVLVTSLTVVGVYLLMLQLFSPAVAFAGALFIALDPFYLAHSRVVQMDALVASFMILSVLSLLVYLKARNKLRYSLGKGYGYLILSAVFGGLALLTKLPAVFLVPYLGLVLLIELILLRIIANNNQQSAINNKQLTTLFYQFAFWLLIASLVFLALYPAMWVKPILTIKNLVYGLVSRGLSADSEAVNTTFYLGKVLPEPGLFFYPLVLAFRSTPLSFVFGIVGAVIGVISLFWKGCLKGSDPTVENLHSKFSLGQTQSVWTIYLLLYTLFFLFQMTLIAKSGDRYLLPVFLALDILAGYGLVNVGRYFIQSLGFEDWKLGFTLCAGSIIIVGFLFNASSTKYSYLSYYNPLFGGAPAAAKNIVVGWGEGLRQAANYLNQKENAEKLIVSSIYADSLQPYFKGEAWELGIKGDHGADYVLLYINQIQRRNHEQFLNKYYRSEEAEKIVKLNNVNYVYIYKVK